MPLTTEQQQAVDMALKYDISVLYGAPGTGKTFALNAIKDALAEKGMSIAMAAPTGKAAKRMTEATGMEAVTIHRLLEPWMDGYNFRFNRNENNPIAQDTVIIDEASMMDNGLAASVMRALVARSDHKYDSHKGHKLLLVGDNYQLPSVGPGSVLRDIIESDKIPKTELTQIQRNAGSIVKACHQIKAGLTYESDDKLNIEAGKNLRHLEVHDPQAIQKTIFTVIDKMAAEGYDPIWDVQVLAPTNDKGPLSCKGLNEVLQEKLNPNAPAAEGEKWLKDDKIINIKNGDAETKTGKKAFLVNGDMGIIKKIPDDDSKMVCRFFDPDREVVISKKTKHILHAYCCTVHRYQGSECPIIIIPVHPSNAFLIDRPWIYTAISRASAACITVGHSDVIWRGIRKTSSTDRKTCLKEKLCGSW